MVGRFIEDGFVLLRFAYFFYKAPTSAVRPGFYSTDEKMPVLFRAKWAWHKTIGNQAGGR